MSSPSPISSQGLPPPPPNPLPTDQPHPTGHDQTSNLYLVAFLAILFLLLVISAGIVARSYILRRRYQRRLENIMSGQLLAPRAQGSKIRRLGTMPKTINTWLAEGGDKWHQMMPVSAQPVFVKRKVKQNTPDLADQTTNVSDTTSSPTRMTNLFSRFHRYLLMYNTLEPEVTDEKRASIPNYRIRVEMLQLAVLVAMPSPRRSRRKDSIDMDPEDDGNESDKELPDMVFGVTRVNYRQPPSSTLPLHPKQT